MFPYRLRGQSKGKTYAEIWRWASLFRSSSKCDYSDACFISFKFTGMRIREEILETLTKEISVAGTSPEMATRFVLIEILHATLDNRGLLQKLVESNKTSYERISEFNGRRKHITVEVPLTDREQEVLNSIEL